MAAQAPACGSIGRNNSLNRGFRLRLRPRLETQHLALLQHASAPQLCLYDRLFLANPGDSVKDKLRFGPNVAIHHSARNHRTVRRRLRLCTTHKRVKRPTPSCVVAKPLAQQQEPPVQGRLFVLAHVMILGSPAATPELLKQVQRPGRSTCDDVQTGAAVSRQ